ncbi:hypothetical protein D917_04057 [Trichinella nativa]|uniref:C2H2-type domain-containing protein n=1 Tax=Trichinella nativa TaxID=6335 RepID=A0A1Y3E5T4_9BILA|nr:hypothetical protein D917_04057 [Trichinella nativa]
MNPHQHQQTNGCYYFTESNDPYSFSVQTTSTLYYNKRATENCESLYANDATAAVLPAVNVSSTELTSTHEMTYTQHPSTLSNNFAIGKIEKRATTQRPYVCPQCGKSFVQKANKLTDDSQKNSHRRETIPLSVLRQSIQ